MGRSGQINKSFKVNFDLCTFCNHQCTFCSNSDDRTIKSSVNFSDFIAVLDNVTQYIKINNLSLSAKGEILLNKDLERIINASKNIYKVPYVYFSTNGSILNYQRSKTVLEAGVDSIKFSINAIDRETYKKKHLKDDFEKVIENLKKLIFLKKDKFPKVKIFISVVTDEAQDKIINGFKTILQESYEELDGILLYALQYTPKDNHIQNQNILVERKYCLISPLNEVYINSDCSLGFCCKDYFDEINFGSLLESDFLSLYNSSKYKNLRKCFINNDFKENSLCYNCLTYEAQKEEKRC